MTCNEFKAALAAYFKQELHPEAAAGVTAHAASCPPCGDLMKRVAELCCREFAETLIHFVEGEIPEDRRAVVELHIALCGDCANYLQSYRATMTISLAAVREAYDVAPGELPDHLVVAILSAAPKRGSSPS